MNSLLTPQIRTDCNFCYTTPLGERILTEVIERFDYWDLLPQPEDQRLEAGRKAAGFLIAGPNLGHIERLMEASASARGELDEIEEQSALLLVRHFSLIDDWLGDYNTSTNSFAKIEVAGAMIEGDGRMAGRTAKHYHKHILPVVKNDVQGGFHLALRSLKKDQDKILGTTYPAHK